MTVVPKFVRKSEILQSKRWLFAGKRSIIVILNIATSSILCSQCGNPLVLVRTVTEKIEGSLFPQTTTIYRCSSQPCQEEIDKQAEKRLSQQKTKDIITQQRDKQRQEKRGSGAFRKKAS